MLPLEFQQTIIREFGLASESPEAQNYLVNKLAENITARVMFEVKKIVPADKHAEIETLFAGSDPHALEQFLSAYVPDVHAFVATETQKEIGITKAYMLEESELAVTGGGQ